MANFNKSQILMLSLVAALIIITPLLSSSLRPKYIYFIINLFIIALGAEAGLLSAFPNPPEDKKHYVHVPQKPTTTVSELASLENDPKVLVSSDSAGKKAKVVEKSLSEKIIIVSEKIEKVKKCPSMPSLFFIGGGEAEAEEVAAEEYYHEEEEEEEEVGGGLSGQELFNKAENFIGNFYKQLKMQREDSWKRIHGFYQKAF